MQQNKELIYEQNYTSLSRTQLIHQVSKMMSPKRFEHVLSVEQTAIKLAERYDAEIEKVSIAALLHDVAKEQANEEMRDLIISENLNLDLLQYGNEVWHGPVGAILAKREFYIQDKEILDSIKQHTVGASEMSLTAQIVFVADYIEATRDFPGVENARKLAEKSLEETVKFKIIETIKYLIKTEKRIYPKTIESYNAWIDK